MTREIKPLKDIEGKGIMTHGELIKFLALFCHAKTIVEIGASQGQSTRLLSHIFKQVIAVEWDDFNLEQAKKHFMNLKRLSEVEFNKLFIVVKMEDKCVLKS